MDIEEISQVLYKEEKQTIKTIPADFYLEAEKYVRKLEEEIEKSAIPVLRSSKCFKMSMKEHFRTLKLSS